MGYSILILDSEGNYTSDFCERLGLDINKTAKNPEYDDLKLKEIDNYQVIYEEKEEAEEINVKFEHFERYFLVTFPPKNALK